MDDDDDSNVVGDFANRLKFEFEERDSNGDNMDEDQDWFVNDKRSPSPTRSARGDRESSSVAISSSVASPMRLPTGKDTSLATTTMTSSASTQSKGVASKGSTAPPLMKKANSAQPIVDASSDPGDDASFSSCPTGFLHYYPPAVGILVMEIGQSEEMTEKRYSSKYFKIYLPQVYDAQSEFCLFARKRLHKNKYRFSLSEYSMSKWTNNPHYNGKTTMTTTPTGLSRKFKLDVPKNAARVAFDIDQEARKQELIVKFNVQSKGFNLFRVRSASADDASGAKEFRSLVQKFINPVADVRCPKTNDTLLKMEKEGDVGYEKYILTYARPFSLFVSCCIAVGIEAHLLE